METQWLWPVAMAVAALGFSVGASVGPGLAPVDDPDQPAATAATSVPFEPIPPPRFVTEREHYDGRLRPGACAQVGQAIVSHCSGGPRPGEASWTVSTNETTEQFTAILDWDPWLAATEELTIRLEDDAVSYLVQGPPPLRLALAQDEAKFEEATLSVWLAPTSGDLVRAYTDQPFSLTVEITHRYDPAPGPAGQ